LVDFAPDRGDIVWLDFDPQAGREQAGQSPALIISPRLYNERVGLALTCPITSRVKGYPFEVPLPEGLKMSGVVLADQVRNLDWRVRNATLIEKLDEAVVARVIARLSRLL